LIRNFLIQSFQGFLSRPFRAREWRIAGYPPCTFHHTEVDMPGKTNMKGAPKQNQHTKSVKQAKRANQNFSLHLSDIPAEGKRNQPKNRSSRQTRDRQSGASRQFF
jgi:hypothetical protein